MHVPPTRMTSHEPSGLQQVVGCAHCVAGGQEKEPTLTVPMQSSGTTIVQEPSFMQHAVGLAHGLAAPLPHTVAGPCGRRLPATQLTTGSRVQIEVLQTQHAWKE